MIKYRLLTIQDSPWYDFYLSHLGWQTPNYLKFLIYTTVVSHPDFGLSTITSTWHNHPFYLHPLCPLGCPLRLPYMLLCWDFTMFCVIQYCYNVEAICVPVFPARLNSWGQKIDGDGMFVEGRRRGRKEDRVRGREVSK